MGRAVSASTLRPVRRPRLPGRAALLRAGLVATLLALAAAVLHAPSECPPAPPAGASQKGAAQAGAARAGAPQVTAPPADRAWPGAPRAGAPLVPTGRAGTPTDQPTTGGGERDDGTPPDRLPVALPDGTVGVPVRLAEPAALSVLRPGARVDLLAVPPDAGEARLLAAAALVLDVMGAEAVDGSSALYLALDPRQARRAVSQPEGTRFAVLVRR
ncbi:flagellar biosynthesis protein FlgA [Micromonospora deserti]|uniref:Flagellar biosynthesis protein FlgA n=1 Tax=Micromonospora deserti TaxID=2070366 RepID=A0A2W2CM29_9ACTN|nr:flagellar biosynthesis protein FlgA [Micromonospora deserti]PZF86376.1 flagellar biosynthesis protein FlgA [Micromonospora deserti]